MGSNDETHTWARSAVRDTVRRCVLSLAARVERLGRTHMAVPATLAEGKEQMALAKTLRKEARDAGWL